MNLKDINESTCFGRSEKMEPNKRSHSKKHKAMSSGGNWVLTLEKAFGVKSLTIGGYDSQCIRISLRLRPNLG